MKCRIPRSCFWLAISKKPVIDCLERGELTALEFLTPSCPDRKKVKFLMGNGK
jgi:hypothetical protein